MLNSTARELYYLLIESIRVAEAADELESIESLVVDFMMTVKNKEHGTLTRCEFSINSDEGVEIDMLSVGHLDADTAITSEFTAEYGSLKFVFEFTGATEFDTDLKAVLKDWLNGEAFYPNTADLERSYKLLKHIGQPGFVCDRLGGVFYELELDELIHDADFVAFSKSYESLPTDNSLDRVEINQSLIGRALKIGSLFIVSELLPINAAQAVDAEIYQGNAV